MDNQDNLNTQTAFQAFQDKEARMRAIVETVLDGIITINDCGEIETVNPAVLKMFGYQESELVGQNVKILMPQPYRDEHDGYLQHYHETGEKRVIGLGRVVEAQRKDGSTFPIELEVSEMEVAGNKMFTGVIRDISAEVAAESERRDAEARNRAILQTIVDGIITINKRGIIETVNPATENLFGYSAEEMVGNNVSMLMPNPYRDNHDGYIAHHLNTGDKRVIGIGREVEGQRKDGSTFPMELAVSDMVVGGELMFTGIVRDITERKASEKMKEEFISTVSHELRTPLTSIRGSIGLLAGGLAGEFNEKAQQLLNMAQNNTERLLLLINDILDISKLEAGKMDFNFKEMEIQPFLEQAIANNQGYAQQHGVSYVLESDVQDARVMADEHRLMQVMSNLMSNAAKFAPDGDKVVVSAVHHHHMIRISVTDHGAGIPKGLEPKIFEKFTQADSSDTRQVGGTGLGLNITKAMVEKHNGRIAFVSEVGVGTTFYFDIPEMLISQDQEIAVDVESQQRILICEDEPDIASLLRLMLAKSGFDSDIANNAAEAEKLMASRNYLAMTLDIMLPDKSGVDLFKELRSSEKGADLPVVFVSAKANQTKLENGESFKGLVEWINKPVDEAAFIHAIESSIQHLHANKNQRILHVEDDEDIRQLVKMLLADDFVVYQAATLAEAKSRLQQQSYDLILLDIGLPDGSGLELIEFNREQGYKPEVVVFSADDIKFGKSSDVAKNLVKSRTSNEELVSTVKKVISKNNK